MINNLSGKDLMMALFLQESIEICNLKIKYYIYKSVGFREDQENGFKYE
jgi:hypothetical protein